MARRSTLANDAASEHVVAGNESLGAARSSNAGAVFVGGWTAQVAGDYAIGSNHVLPTAGAARFRGGLNAADFVKLVSVQRADEARPERDRARRLRRWREPKGLEAHARSIEVHDH